MPTEPNNDALAQMTDTQLAEVVAEAAYHDRLDASNYRKTDYPRSAQTLEERALKLDEAARRLRSAPPATSTDSKSAVYWKEMAEIAQGELAIANSRAPSSDGTALAKLPWEERTWSAPYTGEAKEITWHLEVAEGLIAYSVKKFDDGYFVMRDQIYARRISEAVETLEVAKKLATDDLARALSTLPPTGKETPASEGKACLTDAQQLKAAQDLVRWIVRDVKAGVNERRDAYAEAIYSFGNTRPFPKRQPAKEPDAAAVKKPNVK